MIALLRQLGDVTAITLTNNAMDTRTVTLKVPANVLGWFDPLNPSAATIKAQDGRLTLTVPSLMGRVLISRE